MVASCHLGCEIDLKKLAFAARNAEKARLEKEAARRETVEEVAAVLSPAMLAAAAAAMSPAP